MAETEVNGMNAFPEKVWYESKKFSCHCKDFDMSKMPHLANMLPEGYDQKLCDYVQVEGDEKFTLTLRLNLSTKEEVALWLQNFEERSMTSHVLDKSTNEGAGRLYKLMYRCKLQTYRAAKRLNKDQEHGDCPARITVSIRNPGHRINNRRHPHADTHPTHMRISFIHNHPLDTPEFRSKRKLCPQLKERFESMFKQGMKPRDALNQHKWELQSQLGPEKYLEVALDGFYMPTMGRLCSMYKRITGTTSIKTNTKRISKNNPDADRFSYESCNFGTQGTDQGGEEEEEESGESDAEEKDDKSSYPMKRDELMSSHHPGHWGLNAVSSAPLQEPRAGPSSTSLGPSYDMGRSQVHSDLQQSATAPVLTFQNMESLSFDGTSKGYKIDDPTGGRGIPSALSSSQHHQHPMTPGPSSRPHSQLSDPYLTGSSNRFPLPPAMDLRHVPSQPSHNMAHQGLQGFPQYHTSHGHGMTSFDHHMSSYFYDQNTLGRSSGSQLPFPHHHSSGLLPQTPPVQREDRYPSDIPVSTLYQSEHLPQQTDLTAVQSAHSHNKVEPPPGMKSPTADQGKPQSSQKRKSSDSIDGDKKKKSQKKSPSQTYSVKRFRETLMSSNSTVQPSTQVSAQEALQNIILADKSRAIEERLSSFYSTIEQTMDLDPKLFVPAMTKFLDTWNKLSGEELATALREFGTTRKEVIDEYQGKKYLNSKDKGAQTVRTLTSKPICFSKAIQTSEDVPTTPTADDDSPKPMPSVRSVKSSGVTYMYIDPGDPEELPKRRSLRKRKPRQAKTKRKSTRKAAEVKPSSANPEIRKLLDYKRPNLSVDNARRNVKDSTEGKRQISPRTRSTRSVPNPGDAKECDAEPSDSHATQSLVRKVGNEETKSTQDADNAPDSKTVTQGKSNTDAQTAVALQPTDDSSQPVRTSGGGHHSGSDTEIEEDDNFSSPPNT